MDTVVDCSEQNQNPISDSAWLITENSLGANCLGPYGHACFVETIGSDVAILEILYSETSKH